MFHFTGGFEAPLSLAAYHYRGCLFSISELAEILSFSFFVHQVRFDRNRVTQEGSTTAEAEVLNLAFERPRFAVVHDGYKNNGMGFSYSFNCR